MRGVLEIGEATPKNQRVGVARLSRRAHNPETDRSNRSPATIESVQLRMIRESDECELKVAEEDTARFFDFTTIILRINQSFVGSYTTAL